MDALVRLQRERLNGLALLALCIAVGIMGGALAAFVKLPFAFALVVALIGGLLMLQSTQLDLYALIGVVTLLPFAALPLGIGFNPTLLDLTLLALFGVWVVRLATRSQEKLVTSSLALPILAFITLAFFSFVAGLSHAGLSKETLRHFAEVILSISLFFMVVNVVQDRRQLEGAVKVLILAGFAAAVIGIVLYFLPQALTVRLLSILRFFNYPAGPEVLRFVEDNPELPLRAISTSIDPNVLGGLLILVTSLTAPQLLSERPLFRKGWVAPMLVVMGICMILTFSRGAFGGLGVALTFIGLLRYRRMVLLLLIALLLILVLPQTQWYVQHSIEGLRGEDLATKMRFGEYQDAFTLIARYPWFGVGFSAPPDIDLYIGVSNVYLLMAEYMGLIGLGVFLATMVFFFLQAGLAWRQMEDERLASILLGLMAGLVGAMAGGLLDHYFFNLDFPHSVALFWLYVALAMVAMRLGDKE
jgi:O-antigen ligase